MKRMIKRLTEPLKKRHYFLMGIFICFAFPLCGLAFNLADGVLGGEKNMIAPMIVTAIAAVIFTALSVLAYRAVKKPFDINSVLFASLAAMQCYILSELCINAFFFKQYPVYNLMGYFMYLTVFLLGTVILKNPKIYFCVCEVIFTIYSVAQHYITVFRGGPIKFTDFSNLKSAMEIKGDYKLTFSFAAVYSVIALAALIFFTVKSSFKPSLLKSRLITLGSVAAGAALFISVTNYTYDYGIKKRIITLNYSEAENAHTSRKVGSLLMFYYDGVFNRVIIPEGYSDAAAQEILGEYSSRETYDGEKPVIIAVMNESFADFSHIKEFKTNKDYMPNYHSLSENTIKGHVTVSAYGGYSCNSEYEFLTGNSMYFLPSGSAPFTNYMDRNQDGLVTELNRLGYETVSLTCCGRNLWDIGSAYEYLQFETQYFKDNINLSSKEDINGRTSDASIFKKIEEVYENRDKDKGLFIWTTTMQNHAPYDKDVDGGITLEDNYSEEAERYLNSIYLSDKALGEMIDYFEEKDEHVIVVMFGDHYPHILEFTEDLYGSSVTELSTEDYSRLHQTPFFIWSNKDMESRTIDNMSLNYLAGKVMECAGLPKSPVMQELDKIQKEIPIISGFGYKGADGKWYGVTDTDSPYADLINEYNIVQYYRMFGKSTE